MFPNVRLLIVALLASVVTLSCGFAVLATFGVGHETLSRLPTQTAPLQLVADEAPTSHPISWDVLAGSQPVLVERASVIETPGPATIAQQATSVAPETTAALAPAAIVAAPAAAQEIPVNATDATEAAASSPGGSDPQTAAAQNIADNARDTVHAAIIDKAPTAAVPPAAAKPSGPPSAAEPSAAQSAAIQQAAAEPDIGAPANAAPSEAQMPATTNPAAPAKLARKVSHRTAVRRRITARRRPAPARRVARVVRETPDHPIFTSAPSDQQPAPQRNLRTSARNSAGGSYGGH